MIKTYALVTPSFNLLALPLMTLRDAEKARDTLTSLGKDVLVVNVGAE
jgi:hypothetical protein